MKPSTDKKNMEGVSPTVIGPTGYGNDNSANGLGMGLMAAAALKNGNGYYDGGIGITTQAGICDLRHDVKDAECNLTHSILKAEADIRRDIAKEVGDAKFQLHDNITAAERNTNNRFGLVDVALVRAEMQAKLSAEQVIKEVSTEVRHQAERTQDRLNALDTRFSDKFCSFERRVDAGFNTASKELAECCCVIDQIARDLEKPGNS